MAQPDQNLEQTIEAFRHPDDPITNTAINGAAARAAQPTKKAAAKPRATSKGRTDTKSSATKKAAAKKIPAKKTNGASNIPFQSIPQPKYPRHGVRRALRIPQAILDQNAGHPSTPTETAAFLGVAHSGEFGVEISSAKKYGFLESQSGKLVVTSRAKQALRPRSDTDEGDALREAVFSAPEISDVYSHYRGEYLPDDRFLKTH
ncbi:hypothetical protein GCM10027614_15720 [Micromonospora vulcania]